MNSELSHNIKAEARRLGFFACGIAKAEPVDAATQRHVRQWINRKGYAGMEYMSRNIEKRLDPTLLVPGTKSIISVALNYAPSASPRQDSYQFAAYALGGDYHDIIKQRLRKLAHSLNWHEIEYKPSSPITHHSSPLFRVFVDSAPVLERYWAVRAGLGWIGRNHQLIIPHAGTMFFLGELFVNVELDYDQQVKNFCGNCSRCIDACPTHALSTDPFDASLCLSYQLIENRNELSETAKRTMGDTIYGCDRCQQACPWNRFATPNDDPELQPSDEFLNMTKEDWQNLDIERYRQLFKGSAVKRAKYEGLMRNIKAAIKTEEQIKG